ncbi:MAG: chloride channel protein [Desulfarculaceae bacterium]|nr:chloride channel protein [Desulfarculaceae bacterium]MCF8071304.1 chloride channel protein [Desulfarculaceae bacterium]MCF8101629.1 chloride channel protein [Desulfarculaceae bacterium]
MKKFTQGFWTTEQGILMVLGVVVGVLGGYGAVGFRYLINLLRTLSYGSDANLLTVVAGLPWWYLLAVPLAGGLVVGPLIYFVAREAKGHGVPEVMEAVSLQGGFIRMRVVIVKSLASALSIAVGGSVGREGPIVQIGSAIGSVVGQICKVSAGRMRILVGCGAAAGIAATFNAPVAGMMFAMEIILGDFAVATFSPIVISAVMATAISRFYLGDFPAFMVPAYQLVSAWELLLYAGLGVAAGVVGAGFTATLYKVEDWVDAVRIPEYLKAPLAGVGLGAMGLAFPWVLGVGYEGIELALNHQMVWWLMLMVMVAKIFATSLTIAGGMSGGIFAPSLVIGAMLGGAFGGLAHEIAPGFTAGAGAYAIVGMAGVVAGATHGPITAFLILFEMTGGYQIILPLMIGCTLATMVAQRINPESIYTLKLVRRGINIHAGKDMNLLRSLTVAQAMRPQVDSVPQNMTLGQFHHKVMRSKFASFPVVDERGELKGILSHADYAGHYVDKDLWDLVVVAELATDTVQTVVPSDTLDTALRKISAKDYATLPVVAGPNDPHLVGVLSHRDIISVYTTTQRKSALDGREET